MNHDDKTTPVEQEQLAQPEQARNAHSSHQASRRRLLKAAAVAPVIYTLPNGSALAATSATCLGNNDNIITGVTEEMEEAESCDNEGNCQFINEPTGNLKAPDGRVFTSTGNTVDSKEEFHNDGKDYIYYQGDQTLVAGSCWNSINLSSTKSFDGYL
ncbi:MAG: hypothetical protein ACLFNA_01295 [Halochromatium sp.]